MGLFEKRSKPASKTVINDIDAEDAPWVRALNKHLDTNLRQGAQIANWRMFGVMMVIINSVAVVGNVYQASQSKMIPYLVEVDKLGRTLAVRALDGDAAVTDKKRLIYREMIDLIENLRTVSTDFQANKTAISKAFVRLRGAAHNYATAEMRKAPPNQVGAVKTIQIDVRSAIPISDKTWQVEWEEHTFSLTGIETKVENWKANVQYELDPSGEEKDIRENPIGFYATDLNWLRILK